MELPNAHHHSQLQEIQRKLTKHLALGIWQVLAVSFDNANRFPAMALHCVSVCLCVLRGLAFWGLRHLQTPPSCQSFNIPFQENLT